MTTSGTKEWASSNINISSGCSHDCTYCYAKGMAIRFGRKTAESWKTMELKNLDKNYRKRKGPIMFPSSHDITPEIALECHATLRKLLVAGNNVIVVTKAHLDNISYMCDIFPQYHKQLEFRITITSLFNETSLKWEPYAPLPEERREALMYAHYAEYRTSVSIEPFLDEIYQVPNLVQAVQPYAEEIWIGPMNKKYCPKGKWDEEKWGVKALRILQELVLDGFAIEHHKISLKDSFRHALKVEQ